MKMLLDYSADVYKDMISAELGNTKVFHYICHRNAPITAMISSGIDLEVKDSLGRTPLLAAIDLNMGRLEDGANSALELINAGADVNAADDLGMTVLYKILEHETALNVAVHALVDHGASITKKDSEGHSPLYYALRGFYGEEESYLETISRLLDAGGDLLESINSGETDLHVLARPVAANSIIEDPLDSSARATYDRLVSLYQRFVDAGCNREARDEKGNTPVFEYLRQVRYVYSHHSHPNKRLLDLSICKSFLEKHDITAINENHDTLLHVVARREKFRLLVGIDVALFRLLMEMGLNPRKENNEGVSALDVAALCGKEEIVALFDRED